MCVWCIKQTQGKQYFQKSFLKKNGGFSQQLCSLVFSKADSLLLTCETYLKSPNQSQFQSTAISLEFDIVKSPLSFHPPRKHSLRTDTIRIQKLEKDPSGAKKWTSGRTVIDLFWHLVNLETFPSLWKRDIDL